MVTIITRKALEAWGHTPAPEVESIICDHEGRRVVTWAEVTTRRRARMPGELARKRAYLEWHAYRLRVQYFDQEWFGGWHATLDTYRSGCEEVWIDRHRRFLRPMLMRVFLCVLALGDERAQWEMWKPTFAQAYARRRHHGRPIGVAYLWWNTRDDPRPVDLKAGGLG